MGGVVGVLEGKMNIARMSDGGELVFGLEGRLDTTTAPELQEVLIPAFGEPRAVVLDFSEVEYVSSAGLRVLLMAEKEAGAKGSSMTLKCVSEDVMEVFEMTGFSNMLTIK